MRGLLGPPRRETSINELVQVWKGCDGRGMNKVSTSEFRNILILNLIGKTGPYRGKTGSMFFTQGRAKIFGRSKEGPQERPEVAF